MSAVDPRRARSFDGWAGEYDRFRPGYPEELFQTIAQRLDLPDRPLVVDLGAGTGRASLAMAELGWRVTAVEPGRPLLDILRGAASNAGVLIATVQASAEETGLDPQTADLVTAAQAFHWFEADRALPEMARILKPGGGVALFWNVRDAEASPFLADYDVLLARNAAASTDTGRYEAVGRHETARAFDRHAAAFEPPELIHLRHEVPMTAEHFIGMAFTASYVRAAFTPEQQERFRVELGALLARHRLDHGRPFPVPYRIDLWIARRRGS
ncbi:MAG TPA: class I SAM-dependent methyltransferase [Candidatus Limnocylindria bacterium]|nr:class I SAM-dependent methyltransferase [Candidatus Limnocylindria bacterium]